MTTDKKKPELNRALPFARVYGHQTAVYEQFGRLYDATGCRIDPPRTAYRERTQPKEKHVAA